MALAPVVFEGFEVERVWTALDPIAPLVRDLRTFEAWGAARDEADRLQVEPLQDRGTPLGVTVVGFWRLPCGTVARMTVASRPRGMRLSLTADGVRERLTW